MTDHQGANVTWIRNPTAQQVHQAQLYAKELAQFLIDTWDGDPSTPSGAAAKERYATAVQKCFKLTLFGPMWRADGHLIIYDIGQFKRLSELQDQAMEAIVMVLLPRMPPEPVLAKWTKLLPSASFWLKANVHGLLLGLLTVASEGFQYPQRVETPGGGDGAAKYENGDAHVDADVELTWQQIAGARLQRTKGLLSAQEARFHIHLICVIVEPLRLLHQHFLTLAHRDIDVHRRPLVYKLMHSRSSIINRVCQYYSTMLRGTVDRLCLVWMLWGHQSMEEWAGARPQEALCVRRLILHAASWVWRRPKGSRHVRFCFFTNDSELSASSCGIGALLITNSNGNRGVLQPPGAIYAVQVATSWRPSSSR